eukprot:NODE_288_length_2486_cov_76.189487_g267_i0.p1 GENE.NODE_288_length_2486_cov_76.189487_g267_i0~~NODE_288_length_2486_cov_76.189487_g267_i0.p1  ORF type:complete len:765 (-),score=227.99 NODE_288_length_2486_cov_76.189487_g267_i0:125-2419(-)
MKRPTLKTGVCDFQELWGKLHHDICRIIADPTSTDPEEKPLCEWHELYSSVYKLCTSQCTNVPVICDGAAPWGDSHAQPHTLYSCVKMLFETYITQKAVPEVQGQDEDLLRKYHAKWASYSVGIDLVNSFFHYMNRDWVAKQGPKPPGCLPIYPIRELGLMCWKEGLYVQVRKRMLVALLTQITRDRDGSAVDHALLKGILRSLVQLGLEKKETAFYEDQFEGPFLEATERYYVSEVSALLQAHNLPHYMRHIERRLEEEQRRVVTCLHTTTEEPLLKRLVRVMIENKQDTLLSECAEWFDSEQVDEQKRLYRLLSLSENGLEPLRKIVEDRIDADGKREIEKLKGEAQREPNLFVETLLLIHNKYERMVAQIFQKDPQFINALEKGCRRFVNRNALSPNVGARSAELLARYCHFILRPSSKTSKDMNELELDQHINKVLTIFKLLEDKDVFQKFYAMMLSRRLIQNQYSPEMETNMIAKLKEVCGYEYTYKLQRMFTDMDVSAELNQAFTHHLKEACPEGGPDFSASVLTSGSWPLSAPKASLPLPVEVAQRQALFEEFYRSKHSGRKLSWLHQLSNGILKTGYALPQKRTYELQVTSYQMGILLLFNDAEELSAESIQESTQIQSKDLAFALQVLVKNKLLLSDQTDLPIMQPEQTYSLNFEYKSPHRKVPLHTWTPKETAEDTTMKLVSVDRKYAIQAAIVRVMKARKSISHQHLIAEVLSQLKSTFKPTVPDVKKNIDNLIEKEYMERAEDVPNTYHYVA